MKKYVTFGDTTYEVDYEDIKTDGSYHRPFKVTQVNQQDADMRRDAVSEFDHLRSWVSELRRKLVQDEIRLSTIPTKEKP